MKEWNRVHFSSAREDWETPDDVVAWANAIWGPLTLDVCADENNAKCDAYITKEMDALNPERRWAPHRCWMNPPYGRNIGRWVAKARNESKAGALVVCLLPARTDTRWFHDNCLHGSIWFLKGRLKFGGATNSAPFPSMIVVFGRMHAPER